MNYLELCEIDRNHHLHPFTHHGEMMQSGTHIIKSAQGIYLTDEMDRILIDGLAGLWCVNVGYGREEIAQAVYRQMQKLAYYPSFFNTTTESTIRLAEKLIQIAPKRLTHVFFSNSGSEANETALKMIRAFHKLNGTPKKNKILTLNYGYHGVTLATTSMTQLPSCQSPFDLPIESFIQVPSPYHFVAQTQMDPIHYGFWCIEETDRIIQRENPETIAALFIEPIQGAGGVIVPPEGYLPALRLLCRNQKILFVADEVITGFGRLGGWFASQLWDLDPDLLTTAKGITSGYLPLGATLVSREMADVLKTSYLAHGCTYSGHPSACAAALANLDIIEKENLITQTKNLTAPYFLEKLNSLSDHPAVAEIRGYGLIAALEIGPLNSDPPHTNRAPIGPKAMKIAREEGIVVRGIRDIIALAPPLIIKNSEIDTLVSSLRRVLDRLWNLDEHV